MIAARLFPYAMLCAVVAVIAAYGLGYLRGSASKEEQMLVQLGQARESARQERRAIENLRLELAGAVIARDVARKRDIRVIEKEVIRDVVRYKTSPTPKCDLPPAWLSVHNTAAASRVPENAGTTTPAHDPPGELQTISPSASWSTTTPHATG